MRIDGRWVIGSLMVLFAACATAPRTSAERRDLDASAQATLQTMRTKDPGLNALLASADGYAVFPDIGKAGMVAGGAYGRGILYERGRKVGYVELNQGSIGAQLGAQTFAELIVFGSKLEVDKVKAGNFSLGANASAIALTTGASAAARFTEGVVVFTMPRGGLMAELTVSGQQLNYSPGG